MSTRYYLQAPDGQCLYSIITDAYNVTLVGEVGTASHLGGNKYVRSVLTDGPVASVEQLVKEYEYHDLFTLTDADLESKALPATITKAEHSLLPEHLQDHYRRDVTVVEGVKTINVSDHLALPGDLPPTPAPTNWKPSHWARIYGPNASHLVSGQLVGFRTHIKTIGQTYGDCYDHSSATKMTFNVRAYWSPPRFASSKQGRRIVEHQTWMTSRFDLSVLDDVGGATLADAQINWAAQTAEIVATLDAYGKTKTCGHCDGRGFMVGAP